MMKIKPLIALTCLLLLINFAEAARVAVVVDLHNQTYTKCVTVSDNADAYKVIQETSLDIAWSYFGGSLGHGLCGINEVGCPSENCYCDASKYWGFYVKQKTSGSWSYSQTGFDGGTSCSEHYCAKDGDMIGLAYGEFGTKPTEYEYNEICNTKKAKDKIYTIVFEPQNPEAGDTVTLNVFDNTTKEGIKKIETSLYYKDSKVFSGITDTNGTIYFTVNRIGQYLIKLNVVDYEAPQKTIKLNVTQKTTTTTTTSTTSTNEETTTTSKPTTTRPTTTTSSTTTTLSTTTTTTTSSTTTQPSKDLVIGEVAGAQAGNNTTTLILGVLIIVAVVGFTGYKAYKKRKTQKP
jgi:hypothetical protein